MSRSERIATQLGMSHGTAANRLRKLVLFDLLRRHKENVCFKCGKAIETADELSLEHKQPWEGRSTELFWDLTNIAFSHAQCNRPHIIKTENLGSYAERKQGPEGTTWCGEHKKFLLVEKFYKSSSRPSGYEWACIECISRIRKDYPSRIQIAG